MGESQTKGVQCSALRCGHEITPAGLKLKVLELQGLARNLEQPEIKDWLSTTKDTLMSEKTGKDKESENAKLGEFLKRLVESLAVNVNMKCYISKHAGLMR